MSNLIDYVKWRGDIPFKIDKLNDVDILVLTQISYLNFNGLIPSDLKNSISLSMLATLFFNAKDLKKRSNLGIVINKDTVELFRLASTCLRYSNIKVSGCISKIDIALEEQFSALTYTIGKFSKQYIVVFQGTDDTIIGWKEDFNMAFCDKIPAQTDAVNYVNSACGILRGKFIICGHSKGGNLALFASAFANDKYKIKIQQVYNFDGPGFISRIKNSIQYKRACKITKTFYPYKSIVGMLFNYCDNYSVVDSCSDGLFQHDAMSWQIEKNRFLTKPKLDNSSIQFNTLFNDWLNDIDSNRLKDVIDSLFALLESAGVKTNSEIVEIISNNPTKVLKALNSVDKNVRNEVSQMVKIFIKNSILKKTSFIDIESKIRKVQKKFF